MRDPRPNIRQFGNLKELTQAAGDEFLSRAETTVGRNNTFTVVLSGGSTPKHLYRYLARKAKSRGFDPLLWNKLHFFWGDERMVGQDHPDSNFGMANQSLLSKLPISPDQIHPIKTERGEPEEVADDYDRELRNFFSLSDSEFPRFDLVFLGMGEDGHTASLFPGTDAVYEDHRAVVAPWVEKLGAYRVTLTVPVFNNADCVIFLVSGKNKAETLQKILSWEERPGNFPAQYIRPNKGDLYWFLDRAAARLL